MEISIRDATTSDLTEITGLLRELFEAMTDTEELILEGVPKNCQALLADETHHFLVAENRGDIVGFINFCIRKTCLHPGASGLIDELVVRTSHRAQGIGKKLISAAVERCRELGCCELEVSTESANTTAKSLYKSLGFKEKGIILELTLE